MSETQIDELTVNDEDVSLGSTKSHLLPANSVVPGRKRYLFYFLHRHLNFRLPEAEALAEVACGGRTLCDDGLPPIVWEWPADKTLASPYWFAHLPSEAVAVAIAQDALLVRCIIEVYAEGATWDKLFAEIKCRPVIQQYAAPDQSFKFVLEQYGKTLSEDRKRTIIDSFEESTKFQGKIDLKNPMHKWWVIISGKPLETAMIPALPETLYFGKEVAMGDGRAKLAKYDLKKRRYIGPTSMDAELAFIMCNLGCVRRHSLVLDPNVGTGSMLVAAAAQGALTLGMDIDIRVIKIGKRDAKGEHLNLWTNFRDYNIPYPLGLLRADMHRPPLRNGLEAVLDVVLCDPPYGVRAGGRKSKSVPDLQVKDRATHVPGTAPYGLAECLRDLIELAAKLLVVGGRLVYWIPTAECVYREDELPTHPCLEFMANCEQMLTSRYGRRLITMRKIKEYNAAEAAAHFEALGSPRTALENIHEIVYASKDDFAAANGTKSSRPRMRNKLV